jgi:ferredoxin
MNEAMTTRSADGESLMERLSSTTPAGRARQAALSAVDFGKRSPTSLVEYRSSGELLIIDRFRSAGDETRALEFAKTLSARLRCTVFMSGLAPTAASEPIEPELAAKGVTVAVGRLTQLGGHLGQFVATLGTSNGEVNLARHLGKTREHFDLVLDLTLPPHFRQDLAPLGYYAPGNDREALGRALIELPDLIGEFEKPKFFNYDPDICAHGSRGVSGCTRCLSACPTTAISSIGDRIEVDPYLCQGAGSCATACPTGAITYAYPSLSDQLDGVRALLKSYREGGGTRACLLFHDVGAAKQALLPIADRLPEHVIPLEVEEIGAVGMDMWLAALAYGANHVVLFAPSAVPPSVRGEMAMQLEYAGAMLEGMGHARERLQLFGFDDTKQLLAALRDLTPQPELRSAGFAGLDEKRTVIRLAVDHLYGQAPTPTAVAALPTGAPFGEVQVARDGCTLCMACVSVCPHAALSDGGELPQLQFDEWNCVQCGLCARACPEQVITLVPRFVYDGEVRRNTRILNEDEPFCCVVCGKPFATQRMLNTMQEKLKSHWMFQKPDALRRLQMCEDCRVRDMFSHDKGMLGL